MANPKTISMKVSENYVGMLNEICSKRAVDWPDYTARKSENGEFIITCKMFDNTVTKAQSKVKKVAKRKAAEAMYNMLNARKELRNDRVEFKKCVKRNTSVRLSSSAEPVENYVGKLNEIYFNSQGKRPEYIFHVIESGEIIMQCKLFDNTVTLGFSASRKEAKQQAAKSMINLLNEREKLKKIREKLKSQKHTELKKCAKIVSKKTLNTTENKTFENHVGKLNEVYYNLHRNRPSYKIFKNDDGHEFIVECKILNNVVTRGHSKFRKNAKQEAAKAMLAVLNEREKLRCDEVGSGKETEELRNDPEKLRHVEKESRNDEQDLRNDAKGTSEKPTEIITCSYSTFSPYCRVCGIANEEYYSSSNNTVKKGQSECVKICRGNTVKEMMNDRGERIIDQKHEFLGQKRKKLVKCSKNASKSILNLRENVVIEPISLSDDPFEEYLSELGNTYESYYNNSPSYRIYEVKHDEFIIECSFNDIVTWGQSKFLKVAIRKATEAMLGVLKDKSKFRHCGVESGNQHYMDFVKSAKNLSVSTLSLTENVSIKLGSPIEPFAQPVEKLDETQEKPATNRICGTESDECFLKSIFDYTDDIETLLNYAEGAKNNGVKSKNQEPMKFLQSVKNVSSSTSENVSDNLSFPTEPITSLVEKLNKVCFNNQMINPWYTFCGIENGEFVTKCKIYDGTTTRGQSNCIKDAKEKSAGAMLDILHEREKFRDVGSKAKDWKNDRDEAKFHKYKEFIKCARTFSRFGLNTTENESVKVSLPTKAFVNYVGILNQMYYKRYRKGPSYVNTGTKNGEFVVECGIDGNIVTYGQSKSKRDAKQKAAEAMVKLLNEREKAFEGHKGTDGQRKKLVELDTNVVVKRNILLESSNKNATLVTNFTSRGQIENFVGILNELCSKKGIKKPLYIACERSNGEFVITCEMEDKMCTQGRAKTKKDAKQKAAEAVLKLLTNKVGKENENSNLLKYSTVPFENHVGSLTEICIKQMLQHPVYIEQKIGNEGFMCECQVIIKTVCNVTRGISILKREAKQKAAQLMVELLTKTFKLHYQNLMKSVAITDNTSYCPKISIDEINKHTEVKQSDLASLAYMDEEDLKMELRNLNVNYKISPLTGAKNILKLTTKPTEFDESFTFLTVGQNRLTMSLDLLRQAVFGLKILKK